MATKKFKSDVQLEQSVLLPNKTADRVLINNGTNELTEANVTQTEVERLSGIASALLEADDLGVTVASLTAGKIPSSQLPAIAITDVFTVATYAAMLALTIGPADGEVQEGDVVIVTDASGDPSITSGSASYIYDGSAYQLLKAGDDVVLSVNTQTGAVVLASSDLNHTQADAANWTVATASSIAAHLDELADRTKDLEDGVTGDEKVKISANDTTTGYLEDKVTGAAGKIAVSTLNDGADEDLQITIGADVFDKTVDTTDNVTEGTTNKYYSATSAQDDVGGLLTDTTSIDFTYTANTTIEAAVLPAGVDHDQLLNYEANDHIDHSTVSVETAAGSGLSGGGDITATRSLAVDISGTTEKASAAADADTLLIYDAGATALRKITKANFVSGLLDGVGQASSGDIDESNYSITADIVANENVGGFAFSSLAVRSFDAHVSVEVDATADAFESFRLMGINKGAAGWDMTVESLGDDSGVSFTITSTGQVQYSKTTSAGWTSGTIRFRAITTSLV